MSPVAQGVAGFVALLHLYFMYLEMFMWDKPKGLKVFAQTLEQAKISKTLAFNQGLYNGFLAAGLIWSLIAHDTAMAPPLALFFFGCVAIAGVVGGLTVSKKIFFVQTIPAVVGILSLSL